MIRNLFLKQGVQSFQQLVQQYMKLAEQETKDTKKLVNTINSYNSNSSQLQKNPHKMGKKNIYRALRDAQIHQALRSNQYGDKENDKAIVIEEADIGKLLNTTITFTKLLEKNNRNLALKLDELIVALENYKQEMSQWVDTICQQALDKLLITGGITEEMKQYFINLNDYFVLNGLKKSLNHKTILFWDQWLNDNEAAAKISVRKYIRLIQAEKKRRQQMRRRAMKRQAVLYLRA